MPKKKTVPTSKRKQPPKSSTKKKSILTGNSEKRGKQTKSRGVKQRYLTESKPAKKPTGYPVGQVVYQLINKLKNRRIKIANQIRVEFSNSKALKRVRPLSPLTLPLLLILFSLFLFLSPFFPKDAFQLAKESLARNQNQTEIHLFLAERFLDNNQIKEAERELRLAQYLNPDDSLSRDLWQKKMENDPDDIPRLISGWEKILTIRPGYRDGHLRLAVLYFRMGEKEIARFHLNEAINLDPNFEPARELEKLINNGSK